jgi:hypothetical protein
VPTPARAQQGTAAYVAAPSRAHAPSLPWGSLPSEIKDGIFDFIAVRPLADVTLNEYVDGWLRPHCVRMAASGVPPVLRGRLLRNSFLCGTRFPITSKPVAEADGIVEPRLVFRERQCRRGGPIRLEATITPEGVSRNPSHYWFDMGECVNKQFSFLASNMVLNRALVHRFSQTSQCAYVLHPVVAVRSWLSDTEADTYLTLTLAGKATECCSSGGDSEGWTSRLRCI